MHVEINDLGREPGRCGREYTLRGVSDALEGVCRLRVGPYAGQYRVTLSYVDRDARQVCVVLAEEKKERTALQVASDVLDMLWWRRLTPKDVAATLQDIAKAETADLALTEPRHCA